MIADELIKAIRIFSNFYFFISIRNLQFLTFDIRLLTHFSNNLTKNQKKRRKKTELVVRTDIITIKPTNNSCRNKRRIGRMCC